MRDATGRPHATIIAGPNGSGKSTLERVLQPGGTLINTDDVARNLDPKRPESASFAAGRYVVRQLSRLIESRRSFTYETTLSSHHSLSVMRAAKEAGFEVELVFVLLQTADLCVKRVEDRVKAGGHSIAEPVIRRRYELAFRNLAGALALADAAVVYDNSDRDTVREVLRAAKGRLVKSDLDPDLAAHSRVDDALNRSFGTRKSN